MSVVSRSIAACRESLAGMTTVQFERTEKKGSKNGTAKKTAKTRAKK